MSAWQGFCSAPHFARSRAEILPSISEADQAIRDGIKAGLEDAGFEVDCLGQVIFACKEVRDA